MHKLYIRRSNKTRTINIKHLGLCYNNICTYVEHVALCTISCCRLDPAQRKNNVEYQQKLNGIFTILVLLFLQTFSIPWEGEGRSPSSSASAVPL